MSYKNNNIFKLKWKLFLFLYLRDYTVANVWKKIIRITIKYHWCSLFEALLWQDFHFNQDLQAKRNLHWHTRIMIKCCWESLGSKLRRIVSYNTMEGFKTFCVYWLEGYNNSDVKNLTRVALYLIIRLQLQQGLIITIIIITIRVNFQTYMVWFLKTIFNFKSSLNLTTN